VHGSFRFATVASLAGVLTAGLLVGPAIAQAASPSPTKAAVRLPLSARQMTADRLASQHLTKAASSLTGLAESADGQPLADVCVLAYGPSGVRFAVTGSDGRYFLSGLRTGTYHIRYQGCGRSAAYAPEWYGGAAVRSASYPVVVDQSRMQPLAPVILHSIVAPTAGSAQAAQAAHATAAAPLTGGLTRSAGSSAQPLSHPGATAIVATASGGRISGVVTGPHGKPLGGICVEADQLVAPYGFTDARTAKNGHYETNKLPAGGYSVVFFVAGCGSTGNWLVQVYKDKDTFTDPTSVKVIKGKVTTGIDATLKLGGEISGTITGPKGNKISEVCAFASWVGKSAPLYVDGTESVNGVYHLYGMPAGSYRLDFEPCDVKALAYLPASYPKVVRLKSRQLLGGINVVLPLGGVVSGVVTNAANAPLKGICVYVQPNSPYSDSGSGAVTNAAGEYSAVGLTTGSYTVQFEPSCGTTGNYVAVNYPKPVNVTAAKTTAGIDAVLPPGATVSGTVTGPGGKPLAGICVEVYETDNSNNDYDNAVTSAANGTYSTDQLPTGTFAAEFTGGCGNRGSYAPQAYNNAPWFSPGSITVTEPGQSITHISAAMKPGATITGTVRGPGGRGLSGICVAPLAAEGFSQGGFPVVSRDGSYILNNLLPGQYAMSFEPECGITEDLTAAYYGSKLVPDFISATAGTTSGINAVLSAAGNMNGEVLSRSGKPQPNTCVELTGLSAANQDVSGEGLAGGKYYRFTGLPPGPYQVAFAPGCLSNSNYENQWYKDKPTPAGSAKVVVRAGKTTRGVSSALILGGSLAGTVTYHGKPLPNMCVFAQNISQPLDYGSTSSVANGKYTIIGLNSGVYELEIGPCGAPSDIATQILTRLVRVTAPKRTAGVNFTAQLGGSITGTVLGGSPATPEAGICVDAFASNGLSANSTNSDGNGSYDIDGLAPGEYFVYLNDPGCTFFPYNQDSVWYPGVATQQHAVEVTVVAGQTTKLPKTVTLPNNGAITGTVTGPGKAPLPGICVTTGQAGSLPLVAVTRRGSYTLLGLTPGRYQLEFSSGCGASGYMTQWWKGKGSERTATWISVKPGATVTGVNAALKK
jgi:hypothetical protein